MNQFVICSNILTNLGKCVPMTGPIKWLHSGYLLLHDTMNSWHFHKFANWTFRLSYKQVYFELVYLFINVHCCNLITIDTLLVSITFNNPIMKHYVSQLLARKLTTIANMSCTPFNIIDKMHM